MADGLWALHKATYISTATAGALAWLAGCFAIYLSMMFRSCLTGDEVVRWGAGV
jgi:hypothetical protein